LSTHELTPSTQHALKVLQKSAQQSGIEIEIASGYRSIERQTLIWQRKAEPNYTFDIEGQSVLASELSDREWLAAVMQWSAVPGLSRHHWGTDIDIYDKQALPDNYRLQLIPEEYSPTGIFHRLGAFLDEYIDQQQLGDFFRPYRSASNAISPEAWHLSFAPEAETLVAKLTLEQAATTIPFSQLRAGNLIKSNLEEILEQYVRTYDFPN